MRWNKISLIGLGLMGGSLALAIRQRGLADSLQAYVRRETSIAGGQKLNIADVISTDLAAIVRNADLVILCTPLAQMLELTAQLKPHLRPGAIVTDVGSVKHTVMVDLEPLVNSAKAHFIGSHPMAGSEKNGLSAARADLYQNAICLVTPGAHGNAAATEAVMDFWKDIGATPIRMTAEMHDDLVSRSSHLPHVVAAELANYVLSPTHPKEQSTVCATGFRDTTRIAGGNAELWRDISLANRKNLSRVLGVFIEGLEEFREALDQGDAGAIEEFFQTARERRNAWAQSAPEQKKG